jgi:hypothetical protein
MFPQELAVPGALAVGLFGVALAFAGALLSWRMPRPAFRTIVVGVWAALTVAVVEFLPALGTSRPIYEVAQRLKARQNETIAFWNYRDPSIIFNLGGGVYPVVDPLRGETPLLDSRALASSKPFLCPLTPELLADMSRDPALRIEIVESVSKWDGGTLRHRTVHLVRVALADQALASGPAPTKK